MTQDEFDRLDIGDIVRQDGISYVVTDNYGKRKTAVRTVDMTNPVEWELVNKVPVLLSDEGISKIAALVSRIVASSD